MRGREVICVGLVAVAVLDGAPAGAAAATSPGISLARAVRSALLRVPAESYASALLDSSFPWGLTGGSARESTTVSLRSHLPLREQTIVSSNHAGSGAFSFSANFGYPARARAPQATICSAKS